jgi:hypothetical protein
VTAAFGRGDTHLYVSALRGVWSYDTALGTLLPVALPPDVSLALTAASVAAPGVSGAQLLALVPRPASATPTLDGTAISPDHSTLMACATLQSCGTVADLPLPAGAWLAVSPTYAQDGVVLAGWYDRLYRSSDGGRHFTRSAPPAGAVPTGTITFQTTTAGTVIWSAMFAGEGGILARSDDLGATWSAVLTRASAPPSGAPALLPAGGLLVSTNPRGLLCSGDAGATWRARCPAR